MSTFISHQEGGYLLLNSFIANTPLKLVNLYSPNISQITQLASTLDKLFPFAEGMSILESDFNLALQPTVDISR